MPRTSPPLTLPLSAQEARIARMFALDGRPTKELAAELGLSMETAKTYLKRIRAKASASGTDIGTRHLMRVWLEATGAHLQPPRGS